MGQHIKYRKNSDKYKVFKTLYNDWTVNAVMKRLDITKSVYHEFFNKVIKETRIEHETPIVFNVHAKKPFSENEDDYATQVLWPLKMDSVIVEPEPSDLTIAVKTYNLILDK